MKENIDVVMDACIHLEMWDKALEYGLQSLGPYREFYPEYHPAVGVQCMRVAKLQLFLQQLPEAQKMLQQAHHIINITHGADHPLMRTLKEMLFNCEEEMRVKRMESLNEAEDID
ncbi:histone-lysine N-methyltransferase SMYD3-like [Amphiura filiformis]|uniref:histone-lysine N-methyltransferase SMYD3-like n=1 Tax=Amphiura filiformis TaxID=82378 RepID=UPI003B20D0BE